MEVLKSLPRGNVLFVSNHQTYFADVITFIHIFVLPGGENHGDRVAVLPDLAIYSGEVVAAEETMKSNWLTRFLPWLAPLP